MIALEVVVGIFGTGFVLTIAVFSVAALGDVLEMRKKRGVAARLKTVTRARVRARMIKTPAIRQRLEANRSIIHASNEQALALKRKHDDKRKRYEEWSKRWMEDFASLGGKARELEPPKPPKKEQKSAKATLVDNAKMRAEIEAALGEQSPQSNRTVHHDTIRYNGFTWRG